MKHLPWIFILCALLAACDKENDGPTVCSDTAVVRWGGDPAADGLGWHLFDSVGGGRVYIPVDLPDQFRLDNLPVKVCLAETGEKFLCECPAPLNKYLITSIRKH